MASAANIHTELNPVQVRLLRLFNRPMSDEETLELKTLLVSHYSAMLEKEIGKAVKDRKSTQKDFDDMVC